MPSPREQFEQFRAIVARDPQLLAQLLGMPDVDAFARRAVEVGAERGYAFSPDEVLAALYSARPDDHGSGL